MFSIMAASVYIPTNSVGSSLFSRPSPASIICRLFMMAILMGEMVLHCSFYFTSLIIRDVEHLFICLLPNVCLLWRNVYLGLLPILYWVVFVVVKLYEISVYFEN